jgi:hypothetical protein
MTTETTPRTEKETKAIEIEKNLAYFTGTEQYHRYSIISKLVLTDGAKYLADKAGAYWLMDIISSYQPQCQKDEMLRDFQLWTLNVNEDNSATIKCERDTNDVAITQDIPFTDFPLKEIKLYCINNVILLTSEY